MDNNYLWMSAVSVKCLPCSLQFQNVLRMFNSKKLSDCKLTQPAWDVTISIVNAGHAPGWHHTRSLSPRILSSHVVSPGSGINTGIHTPWHTSRRLHLSIISLSSPSLIQLSVRLTGLPQNHRRPAALPHLAHLLSHLPASHQHWIPHIRPNTYLTADDASSCNDHKYSSTQHSTTHWDHRVHYAVQLLSLLCHPTTFLHHASGGKVL